MTAAPSDAKLRWLDALRGIGAVWVVLFHLNKDERFPASAYQAVVGVGWLGVIIFFVVSGACLQLAAQRSDSVGDFAWRRFWRVYPPYLASLALTVAVVAARLLRAGAAQNATALPSGAGGWMAHLLVAFSPTTSVDGVNWVYWTLTCEIAFYAVIGLCVWRRRLTWPLLIGLTAAACALGDQLPALAFPLRYWSFFALGAAIAEQRRRPAMAPLLLAALCGLDLLLRQGPIQALTGALTALSVVACMAPWGAWLNRERLFSWVGRWSYSLYLIHVPIGVWLGLALAHSLLGPAFRHGGLISHIAGDLGLLLLASAAALLFFRLAERPSIAMMARQPARLFSWPTLSGAIRANS